MEKQKCPELRFNGFFEVWNIKKLSDLGSIQTGSTPSTSDESYYSKTGLMWVTPTDINGQLILNTDKKLSILGRKKARVVPPNTILVTCIASIGKNALLLEEGSFNQQINSLTPFERNDPYFLLSQSYFWSNVMQQFAAKGTMQIVNKTQFSNIETFVPSRLEQSSIGNFFQNLDQSIALHEKKLTQTQNFKKAMLEKMFPKQGTQRPEIRLKGFSRNWKIEAIGDVLKEVFRPINLDNQTKYRLVTVKRRNGGIAERAILKGKDILVKSQFEVKAGDYIISKRQVVHGATGLVPPELDGSVVSNEYLIGQGTDQLNIEFFALLSTLPEMYQKFFLSSYGVDIEKLFFDVNDWKKREVLLPSLEEQVRISSFFKQVDETLKLQKQQLQTLKNLKQALLEKMFV
ncbi:restriction endonuclease subunit S [Acinetobacter sp. AS5]|uniref:restriction endonuclease subunit S n=1 Tax=Acinetobacter sp. AS5 TaxID=3029187 RepID=UPI0024200C40|nr:restriction endonuclease subunit S [Acinetobacter lwoffii]